MQFAPGKVSSHRHLAFWKTSHVNCFLAPCGHRARPSVRRGPGPLLPRRLLQRERRRISQVAARKIAPRDPGNNSAHVAQLMAQGGFKLEASRAASLWTLFCKRRNSHRRELRTPVNLTSSIDAAPTALNRDGTHGASCVNQSLDLWPGTTPAARRPPRSLQLLPLEVSLALWTVCGTRKCGASGQRCVKRNFTHRDKSLGRKILGVENQCVGNQRS